MEGGSSLPFSKEVEVGRIRMGSDSGRTICVPVITPRPPVAVFTPVTIADKSLITRYLRYFPENEGSECQFSNMLLWSLSDHIEWSVVNDALLLRTRTRNDTACMMMVFTQPERLCEGLELAVESMQERGEEFRMCSLPEWYVRRMDACSPGRFAYTREPHHDDYVYEASALISLSGKALHAKRNHVNKFRSTYGGRYQYEAYHPSFFAECMDAYNRWLDERGESPELCAERGSVECALRYADQLALKGGMIRVDGVVEAFTLGERITADMALIHVEKANLDMPGLFAAINQMFLENAFPDAIWVNREEDMGLEGLRKAKRSYHPTRMIDKYGATLA
ncbi:MAG: phosphatidylglycerol lysyltransferase domain-containing protein [Oscillospiraceae bacterium]|nr:phosphatidylglycerol lysyltransferase domain-containing protein [Oscillospiraceae bacterium]